MSVILHLPVIFDMGQLACIIRTGWVNFCHMNDITVPSVEIGGFVASFVVHVVHMVAEIVWWQYPGWTLFKIIMRFGLHKQLLPINNTKKKNY